jgi:hypothetical protein
MSRFYDPFNGSGTLVNYVPGEKAVWTGYVDGDFVSCTQRLVAPILDANKEKLNNSIGKRWGDGQIAAEIPVDFYYDKLMPAKKVGDDQYIKKILNSSDYRDFRTFGGKL